MPAIAVLCSDRRVERHSRTRANSLRCCGTVGKITRRPYQRFCGSSRGFNAARHHEVVGGWLDRPRFVKTLRSGRGSDCAGQLREMAAPRDAPPTPVRTGIRQPLVWSAERCRAGRTSSTCATRASVESCRAEADGCRDAILTVREGCASPSCSVRARPVNSCCEYEYFCPTVNAVKCYAHGGFDKCCDREELHECVSNMYGSDDGLMFGDGFICYRCGNYEAVGNHHGLPRPGFPRKTGPPRRGTWLDDPPA
jgi:hypothetical protein